MATIEHRLIITMIMILIMIIIGTHIVNIMWNIPTDSKRP